MKLHIQLALVVIASGVAAPAMAWDPFVTPNANVETGNERMSAGDAAGALAAYDLAARQHPEEPRVALDRGLALLASGDLPAAREAFVSAADPDADDEIRAAAYYDLGLAFYQEGDASAGEEDHEASQGFFREAADAFRRSLRVTPGNRDAAWNLELALRRIREQEEAQEQQERQEQEDQEQQEQEEGDEQDDQQGDEQGDQEGDEQGDQEGDEQSDQGDQGDQSDEGEGDEQEQDQQGGDEEGDEQSEGQEGEDPEEQSGEQEGDSDGEDQGGDDQTDQHPDQGEQQEGGENLPSHVERVLDALQDNEQNLERARARARAAREGRRVLRDW